MNSKTQIRIFVILERMWLFAALIGIAATIYFLVIKDNDSALFFLGFFILSGLLYLLRKRQRVKHESYLASKQPPSKP
jgi:LPXTG-motif cell wall-anchored protein